MSQVIVLVNWKFENRGERFDWSIERVAVGKYVIGCDDMCGDKVMQIDGKQNIS